MASLRAFQTEIDAIHAKTAAETKIAAATTDKSKVKSGKDIPDVPKTDATVEPTQDEDEDLAVIQVCTLRWPLSNLTPHRRCRLCFRGTNRVIEKSRT